MSAKATGFIDWFTPKRTITIVIMIIVIAVVVYFSWSKLKKLFGKINESTDKAILEAKGVSLTYPKGQYITFADTINAAFGFFNDDEDAIYAVFNQLRNDLDFLELKEAYGLRPSVYQGTNQTLSEALKSRLDSTEIAKINSILRTNNITYQI